jgi:hypothetical protein
VHRGADQLPGPQQPASILDVHPKPAELNPVRLRSLVTGQANVLLVSPRLRLGEQRLLLLTPGVGKWEWLFRRGRQQRYLQAVDVDVDGVRVVVANLHATNEPRRAAEEAALAADFLADAERCVLCGDFNAPGHAVAGFSPPIAGIDQVLVRGLGLAREAHAWPLERRRLGDLVLSDHAPVEAVVA